MNSAVNEILKSIETVEGSVQIAEEHKEVLSDMFRFIKGMIPIVAQVRVTVGASTDHIPEAADNISHVSNTTETATTEVMDKLDVLMNGMSALESEFGNSKSERSQELISEMSNSISDIMNALQFQDITSQKLEHTSRILNMIYDHFLQIFDSLLNSEVESSLGKKVMDSANEHDTTGISDQVEDKVHSNGISQDDIDQFFK